MINILLFLVFIACVSLAAIVVVDNPGTVTIVWFGLQIKTSPALILLAVLLTALAIIFITLISRKIVFAPSRMLEKRNANQLKLGLSELTYSIAELASSNVDAAEKHAHKVEKLIGKTPLTLLISAQIAKNRGDENKTQVLLEQLLTHKETEYLAARSLSDSANKQDNLPKALSLAQKAQGMDKKNISASLAVVSLHVRMKQWQEAFAAVQNSKLARRDKKRITALIDIERGQLLIEDGRSEEALNCARNAIYYLPDFPPAIAFASRAYHENSNSSKAIRLLTKAWRKHPVPIIADTLRYITMHEPKEKQEKILAKLSGNPQSGIWNCNSCNNNQLSWKLHCDTCHSFDTLTWH